MSSKIEKAANGDLLITIPASDITVPMDQILAGGFVTPGAPKGVAEEPWGEMGPPSFVERHPRIDDQSGLNFNKIKK